MDVEAPPPPSPPVIKLRPFQPSDIDDFFALAGDDRVTEFTRWDTFTGRDQALEFLEHTVIPAPWFRAVCLDSVDSHPIGLVSFRPGTGNDRCRGEIGYGVVPEQWGRGIATAAVKVAVKAIFDEMPEIERIQGMADVENLASRRVMEKAGFLEEGVLRKYLFLKGKTRDCAMYSFLSTDL